MNEQGVRGGWVVLSILVSAGASLLMLFMWVALAAHALALLLCWSLGAAASGWFIARTSPRETLIEPALGTLGSILFVLFLLGAFGRTADPFSKCCSPMPNHGTAVCVCWL